MHCAPEWLWSLRIDGTGSTTNVLLRLIGHPGNRPKHRPHDTCFPQKEIRMPRQFTPKVVTANALIEGDVVYLTADNQWTRHLAQAELLDDQAHAELRLLDAETMQSQIVGAYLADFAAGPTGPEPTHFREEFRRTGPSNYHHGKQAELTHV